MFNLQASAGQTLRQLRDRRSRRTGGSHLGVRPTEGHLCPTADRQQVLKVVWPDGLLAHLCLPVGEAEDRKVFAVLAGRGAGQAVSSAGEVGWEAVGSERAHPVVAHLVRVVGPATKNKASQGRQPRLSLLLAQSNCPLGRTGTPRDRSRAPFHPRSPRGSGRARPPASHSRRPCRRWQSGQIRRPSA